MDQNIGRIDHVVWICHPENLERYVDDLSKLCQVQFYGPIERDDIGLKAYVSWSSGMEVITPTSADSAFVAPFIKHLAEHGEGLMSVVFGVADIGEACQRAKSLGHQVGPVVEMRGDEPYAPDLDAMKEALVPGVLNSRFVFGEIRFRPTLLGYRQ